MRFAVIARAVLVSLALVAPAAAQPGSELGTLAVTVRPAIADVFIDGNRDLRRYGGHHADRGTMTPSSQKDDR